MQTQEVKGGQPEKGFHHDPKGSALYNWLRRQSTLNKIRIYNVDWYFDLGMGTDCAAGELPGEFFFLFDQGWSTFKPM